MCLVINGHREIWPVGSGQEDSLCGFGESRRKVDITKASWSRCSDPDTCPRGKKISVNYWVWSFSQWLSILIYFVT